MLSCCALGQIAYGGWELISIMKFLKFLCLLIAVYGTLVVHGAESGVVLSEVPPGGGKFYGEYRENYISTI